MANTGSIPHEHRRELADGPRRQPGGRVLECRIPHCDPRVNPHNVHHGSKGDTLIDIWPIDARRAI